MNAREIAESYFARIPDGHRNAIQRPDWNTRSGSSADRILRKMIEHANHNGDCIINVGRGIYRPDPNDPVDLLEFKEYVMKDKSRAESLDIKITCMEQTMESRRKGTIHAEQQRKRRQGRAGACEGFEQLRLPF